MKQKILQTTLLVATLLAVSTSARAAFPLTFTHQGRIAVNGQNFTGTGGFKFLIYRSDGVNEIPVWSNAATTPPGMGEPASGTALAVNKGLYSAVIGGQGMQPLPPNLEPPNPNGTLHLRIWFSDGGANGTFEQLLPDQQILSVPFARKAAGVIDGAITGSKIANNSVTGDKIAPAAITGSDIASGAVSMNKIATGSVTAAKISSGAITSDKLGVGAVTSEKIAPGAVSHLGSPDGVYPNVLGASNLGSLYFSGPSIGMTGNINLNISEFHDFPFPFNDLSSSSLLFDLRGNPVLTLSGRSSLSISGTNPVGGTMTVHAPFTTDETFEARAGIDVTGDITTSGDISIGGAVKYDTPKLFYYHRGTGAFRPNNSDASVLQNVNFLRLEDATTYEEFTAPVDLPDGAIVKKIEYFYHDGDSDEQFTLISAGLYRRAPLALSATPLRIVTKTNTATTASPETLETGWLSLTPVNNQDFCYQIGLGIEVSATSTGLKFFGSRITYELDRASR